MTEELSFHERRAREWIDNGARGKPPTLYEGGYYQQTAAAIAGIRLQSNDLVSHKPLREEQHLSVSSALELIQAALYANHMGVIMNAMFTISWWAIGVDSEEDIDSFTRAHLQMLRKFLQDKGGAYMLPCMCKNTRVDMVGTRMYNFIFPAELDRTMN